jgi:hypothetical protein
VLRIHFATWLGTGDPILKSREQSGRWHSRLVATWDLRYEEIACDATLANKLKETKTSNVPTILFGDPASLRDGAYAQPMREYDDLYLLNCGALVPWDEESKKKGNNDDAGLRA